MEDRFGLAVGIDRLFKAEALHIDIAELPGKRLPRKEPGAC